MHTNLDNIASQFKTLGDPVRLRIVNALMQACCPLCVCELVDVLELQQYQVSRQLRALKQAGLVTTHKEGTWVYYALSDTEQVNHIRQCLENLLTAEQCKADIQKLNQRLALRSDGRCVVGFVSEDELNQLMKSAGTSTADDHASEY